MNELRFLFDKYNCDKGRKHEYDFFYTNLFEKFQDKECRILEIGVWKGASTRALLDYMPKAKIVGLDLFERVDIGEVEAEINSDRVTLIQGNSFDSELPKQIRQQLGNVKFDFIIDDGAHYPQANLAAFTNFYPMLKTSGAYVVEDWWNLGRMTPAELRHPWLLKHSDRYTMKEYKRAMDHFTTENLTEHDMRHRSGEPDSFILEIRKK